MRSVRLGTCGSPRTSLHSRPSPSRPAPSRNRQLVIRCTESLFFFNDTATTQLYTLPLHDALPIFRANSDREQQDDPGGGDQGPVGVVGEEDRKSTRLNSSHVRISYAVLCLKK